jgi:hypothetical protein
MSSACACQRVDGKRPSLTRFITRRVDTAWLGPVKAWYRPLHYMG